MYELFLQDSLILHLDYFVHKSQYDKRHWKKILHKTSKINPFHYLTLIVLCILKVSDMYNITLTGKVFIFCCIHIKRYIPHSLYVWHLFYI